MTHSFILFCAVAVACLLGLLLQSPVISKVEDVWIEALEEEGIDKSISKNLGHNQTDWFYFNKKMCIGYGAPDGLCDTRSKVCVGDKNGTMREQVLSIKLALANGFEHPNCPLVY